jgi:hypothetical protein
VKLQLLHWRSSAPARAEVFPYCATGAGLVAVKQPIQRLFSRWASLTVAFVAAALLAACGGGGGVAAVAAAPTASNVAISGTAQVGQLLTGTYTYADANNYPEGSSTFRWLRGGVAIIGAIKFEVTPVSTVAPTTGTPVASSPTAAVAGVGVAPTASSVAINDTAQVHREVRLGPVKPPHYPSNPQPPVPTRR